MRFRGREFMTPIRFKILSPLEAPSDSDRDVVDVHPYAVVGIME